MKTMTRQELIETLIHDDIHGWNDPKNRDDYLHAVLSQFVYKTQSDAELIQELNDRELFDQETQEKAA
jgi:hypothetical protein